MGTLSHFRFLPRRTVRFALPRCAWLLLALLPQPADALTYPWVLLSAENDSRDPEMQARDEARSLNMVAVINRSETIFEHHLLWKKCAIRNLLAMQTPFCEMHFDAVRPFELTPEEKAILAEYLKRGGFILFFIDAYPYTEEQFRPVKQWPLIDFLTRELPASDPQFTTGRATDDSPIFKIHYKTETSDPIKVELAGNPNSPNRTLIYYHDRLCCFVMGEYSDMDHGVWVPLTRPFPRFFSTDLKSYHLIVNIYTYSIVK